MESRKQKMQHRTEMKEWQKETPEQHLHSRHGEPPVQTGARGQRKVGELPPGEQTCSKNSDEFSHTFGLVKIVILEREGEI